jgi:predicted permease
MSWTRFFRRRHWDDERGRELDAYLDIETDDNIARGMSPGDARAAARRKLGNATLVREEIYRMNTLTRTESIWQDFRYGLRLLLRAPGFACVALVSLGLGIGANTALFHLLDAVRLRTLPVDRPHELVEIRIQPPPNGRTGQFNGRNPAMTYPLWKSLEPGLESIGDLFIWADETFDLSLSGESRSARGVWLTGDAFETLGIRPAAGRLFSAADDRAGCAPLVAISYPFWQREYGGRADAIGQTIHLDRHQATIVGVTPESFFGPEVGRTFDVAIPLCAEPALHPGDDGFRRADTWWLTVMGRLKPGHTLAQATAELESRSPGIFAATTPADYTAAGKKDYGEFKLHAIDASTGFSTLRRSYETPLWLLLAIAGAVLLIACGNLANLMLARATAREREIAVRLAIGASRWRVIRQFMSESLLLALAGAALGVGLAQVLSPLLLSFLSTERDPLFLNLEPDLRVLGFAVGLATITCLLFGLLPAIRATRTPPVAAMRSGGRAVTDGRERYAARRFLVVAQVAVSLVLLVGAALFVRTLANLSRVDPGFDSEGVTVARIGFGTAGGDPETNTTIADNLIASVSALPGVRGVTAVAVVPLGGGGWNEGLIIDGKRQSEYPNVNRVDARFFEVMGIPLRAGRNFDVRDRLGAAPVAVVNQAFANAYFPDGRGLGRRFRFDVGPSRPDLEYEIVGIVGDTQYFNLREDPPPTIFLARTQNDQPSAAVTMLVRSAQDSGPLTAAIVRTATSVAPGALVVFDSLDRQVQNTLRRERLMATLSGLFGTLAAVLAMTGLYGVMSYMVTRRRNEIGLRMALGAGRGKVLALILKEATILVAIGVVIGTGLAILLGRYTESLLFGLTPGDPTTMAGATIALMAVAGLAGAIPAWRASRVEPTTALRAE